MSENILYTGFSKYNSNEHGSLGVRVSKIDRTGVSPDPLILLQLSRVQGNNDSTFGININSWVELQALEGAMSALRVHFEDEQGN